jgi:tight adherence protein B
MTLAWLLIGLAVALVPLGSRGSLRLAALGGHRAEPTPTRAVRSIDLATLGRPAAVGSGGLVAVLVGPALGAAVALAVGTAAWLAVSAVRRRQVLRRRADAVAVVQLVQAELEAGADPAVALEAGADHRAFGADLAVMAEEIRQARDPTTVVPIELVPLAHAMRVCAGSGASAATVLATVRDQLQSELDRCAAVTAALAGVRASAVLLALLPAVGVALGAGLGVNPLRLLLTTPSGHLLVLIGVGLECVGLWWTSRMAARAEGLSA